MEVSLTGHDYYMKVQREYLVQKMETMNPGAGLVFIGDSITNSLNVESQFQAINLGIAGNKVAIEKDRVHLYSNLDDKTIVVALGTNDLPGNIESIAENYKALLEKLPSSASILISSVLPVDEAEYAKRWGTKSNQSIEQLNRMLQNLAEKFDNAVFYNSARYLLDGRGQLCEACHYDGIHLSRYGYLKWVRALREGLGKLESENGIL
ncbi:hypothetical protein HBA55_01530 [Pseudomaricurvus alkylphenolicus]|uniref:GDSL-type esterase/lipase family protein n=1 Tax=Pseudomaricurvus alkylphenolicus TaxID=1306991 RepID=UPI0014234FE6|nr:GDSL-type esterase/lipase family protein [Pseudomaricurvus alkylphenolicus]NIB38244.1 hypothetical protein [Pseudomaricurvus alkylphenolicus]